MATRNDEPPALSSKRDSPAGNDDGCALYEMMQYHCKRAADRVVCQAVERILQRCPGRPAVDVTHVVATDRLGNVYLPREMQGAMPPAKHWGELS